MYSPLSNEAIDRLSFPKRVEIGSQIRFQTLPRRFYNCFPIFSSAFRIVCVVLQISKYRAALLSSLSVLSDLCKYICLQKVASMALMPSHHILALLSFCFLLFSPASSSGSSISDPSRCHAINALLPGKVFFPGDGGYNSSDQSYFFAEARLTPACIVTPASATDVATTIQVLGKSGQGNSAPLFAIRGGGLLPNVAAANINRGVTIDLSAINSTIVNEDKTIASIGSGARWGSVYQTLDALDLGAVGARIATAGVGGYFVGGKFIKALSVEFPFQLIGINHENQYLEVIP
jgi:hypothetical protein